MIRINLLPREKAARRPVAPRLLAILVIGILLVGVAAATLFLNRRNAGVRAQVDSVNRQIDTLRPRVQQVEELRRAIEAARKKEQLLRRLEEARVPWDQVLAELRRVLPTDVWLTQVEAYATGEMVFNGYGLSYESVARFMTSLEGSDRFEAIDMLISQKQKISGREVVNFSVTGRLVSARKEAVNR